MAVVIALYFVVGSSIYAIDLIRDWCGYGWSLPNYLVYVVAWPVRFTPAAGCSAG